jgi:putative endonuclease
VDKQAWSVYILECSDGSLYTGISVDLAVRIQTHNLGKGAKYTRSRLPVKLLYNETMYSRSDALKREAQIKKLSATAKRQLIASDGQRV